MAGYLWGFDPDPVKSWGPWKHAVWQAQSVHIGVSMFEVWIQKALEISWKTQNYHENPKIYH